MSDLQNYSSCVAETLYPLTNVSPFFPPPHNSIFCSFKFARVTKMCTYSISKIYFVFLPEPYYYSILFFSLLKIGTQSYIFTFFCFINDFTRY